MQAIIKTLVEEDRVIFGAGNKGGGFPLVPPCPILEQIPLPLTSCSLGTETAIISSEYIIFETATEFIPFNFEENFLITITCPPSAENVCYLALQEDSFTYLLLESSEDWLAAPCAQD